MSKNFIYLFLLLLSASCTSSGQIQRGMVFNSEDLAFVKSNLGKAPLFDKTLAEVKKLVDDEIVRGSDVPLPKDMAGGYSHETHRRNYLRMEQASYLYKITDDTKYSDYVKEMLLRYTKLYPTLGLHPVKRSYSRGKLFWQCLNDANWLVSVSQAYANIKESLNKEEKWLIEAQLLKPYAEFLSIENPQFFNRIHNHSTWGCSAVGMTGLAIGDQRLVDYALYGIPEDNIAADAHDNDGALIKSETKGFLAQIDGLFSPDGLYSEGPYYHRYAIYPFLLFAVSLENAKPEIGIFKYRDGSLLKSVNTLLAESNEKGDFFPINDAQKGMSIYNPYMVAAVDIAYKYGNQDHSLLSVAEIQKEVLLDASGMAVALNLKDKTPLIRKSVAFSDGKDGNLGGLAILRSAKGHEVLFKFGSQGMGHGHFDKLSYSFYQNGEEVVQDYGMARFVNIEQKGGGGYLKENNTFAKQSIGHNTLVVNETSHSGGDTDYAETHAPTLDFKDFSNQNVQGISATDVSSYPDLKFTRSLFIIDENALGNTLLIDLMHVKSEKVNQYDVPLYYQGQWLESNFPYKVNTTLNTLGTANGYQHIWKEGSGILNQTNAQFSWINKGLFYTNTSISENNDEIIMGRVGATDPEFNLRRDPVIITRRKGPSNTTFANIIESHGSYSPIDEKARNPYGIIEKLEKVIDTEDYTVLKIITKDGQQAFLAVANSNFNQKHSLTVGQFRIDWDGPFTFKKIDNDK